VSAGSSGPRALAGSVLQPLVSVVTPTLNRADYLEATLESVRDQSYPYVEHIVVDGGSTDGTLEILKRHEDLYNLRWISESDGGMYAAINKGLHLAKGEVLAYLNSDDMYLPWTIEVAVRAFGGQAGPMFVFGDAVNVDVDGTCRLVLQPPFDAGYVKRTGFLVQPTVFWSRPVYESQGGFDERFRYVADCDYWMRAADRLPFRRVNEVLAIERDHPGTQRASQAGAVNAEIALLRREYRSSGISGLALGLRDRGRAYFWRRILLMQFLLSLGRPARSGGAWSYTRRAGRPTVGWRDLSLSLVPRYGARFYPSALRWGSSQSWPCGHQHR